jgi:DUF1009 family protein
VAGGGGTLGIIAGAGELPIAIAEAASNGGRDVFLVGIAGLAKEKDLAAYRHGIAGIGELGKMVALLREANCAEVTFAGRVPRPNFSDVKFDARGAMVLPKLLAAAVKGDDALLRAVLGVFEGEGLTVIGSDEAARALIAVEGAIGRARPTERDRTDMARGLAIVRAMGDFDIGQAAIVCDGLVLAVEAAEGTDEMLRRAAALPPTIRGSGEARRGVLVKAPKPAQERRVDLPVIGVRTVELAAAAGLAGIAVEGGSVLIMNRAAVAEAVDKAGLFLIVVSSQDIGA